MTPIKVGCRRVLKSQWSGMGYLKTRDELSRPDTQQAEQWLTPDLFLFKGKPWEVLVDGSVISRNGQGTQGRLFN